MNQTDKYGRLRVLIDSLSRASEGISELLALVDEDDLDTIDDVSLADDRIVQAISCLQNRLPPRKGGAA